MPLRRCFGANSPSSTEDAILRACQVACRLATGPPSSIVGLISNAIPLPAASVWEISAALSYGATIQLEALNVEQKRPAAPEQATADGAATPGSVTPASTELGQNAECPTSNATVLSTDGANNVAGSEPPEGAPALDSASISASVEQSAHVDGTGADVAAVSEKGSEGLEGNGGALAEADVRRNTESRVCSITAA